MLFSLVTGTLPMNFVEIVFVTALPSRMLGGDSSEFYA